MAAHKEAIVLADSNHRPRPQFSKFLSSDACSRSTVACFRPTTLPYVDRESLNPDMVPTREHALPAVTGKAEVVSFKDVARPSQCNYKKWNDEGLYRASVPLRAIDGAHDPVSGFVSVGGRLFPVAYNVVSGGQNRMPNLDQIANRPNDTIPTNINSDRFGNQYAPVECRRNDAMVREQVDTSPTITHSTASESSSARSSRTAHKPYKWNSIRLSDASIRSSLGGWTTDDPRLRQCQVSSPLPLLRTARSSQEKIKAELVTKFVYNTTSERFNGDTQWDKSLTEKRWPATTTLEARPDMVVITPREKQNGFHASCRDAQKYGRMWESLQTKKVYYKTNIPIPGTNFCTPYPREKQIPGYRTNTSTASCRLRQTLSPSHPLTSADPSSYVNSGCIGATNLDDIDNSEIPFNPLTVNRQTIPQSADTSQPRNKMDYNKDGVLSKMVTTVQPHNPFKRLNETIAVL